MEPRFAIPQNFVFVCCVVMLQVFVCCIYGLFFMFSQCVLGFVKVEGGRREGWGKGGREGGSCWPAGNGCSSKVRVRETRKLAKVTHKSAIFH